MRHIRRTQGVLLAALLLGGLAWAIDALTGANRPSQAQAVPAQPADSAVPPVNWDEVTALVTRLTQTTPTPINAEFSQLQRDLFMPTPAMNALAVAPLTAALSEGRGQPAEGQAAEPKPDFGSQHELVGVIIGRHPLAVVDNRLLPPGAHLDGHVLREVQRDYVVFQHEQTQERVTLRIKQRGEHP